MAQAFKCDRCDKFYSAEDDNYITNELRIVIKNKGKTLDICSNCAKSFLGWLNQWENKENDNSTDV